MAKYDSRISKTKKFFSIGVEYETRFFTTI